MDVKMGAAAALFVERLRLKHAKVNHHTVHNKRPVTMIVIDYAT